MGNKHPHIEAILIAIAAYFFWSCGDIFNKLLGMAGVPKIEIVALTSAVSASIIAIKSLVMGDLGRLKTKRIKIELFRSALLFLVTLSGVTAVSELPITLFYIGAFLSPIFALVLSDIFLKERPSFLQGCAIVAGFVGVVVAIDPFNIDFSKASLIGWLALLCFPLAASAAMTVLRAVSVTETSESIVFIPQILRVIVFTPICFLYFKMPSPVEVVYILCGGACLASGFTLATLASKRAPMHIVMPFNYTQLITGALAGFFIWNEVPGWNLWMGAAIIIASGIYIMMSGKKTA